MLQKKLAIAFVLILVADFISCGANFQEQLSEVPEYDDLKRAISANKAFNGFDAREAWRLLIDGRYHGYGPLTLDEDEPGYLAGLSKSLVYALEYVNEPVSISLLEKIHDLATENVKKKPKSDSVTTTGGSITTPNETKTEGSTTTKENSDDDGVITNSDQTTGGSDSYLFGRGMGRSAVKVNLILGNNATQAGIAQLRKKIKNDPLRTLQEKKAGKSFVLLWSATSKEEMIERVTRVIETYEASEKTPRDIVILSQDLEQLHPFRDGNTRTTGIVLVQKELVRNKFTPVIHYNPNRYDGFSVDELLEREIKEGQKRFKSFVKN